MALLVVLAFVLIKAPLKPNKIRIGIINKIILGLGVAVIAIVLLLAISLLSIPNVMFMILTFTSILSMVSLIIIIIKTIAGSETISIKYIYAAHSGVLITLLGMMDAAFSSGNKIASDTPPLSLFIVGIIVLLPYFYIMVLHNFFLGEEIASLENES